MTTLILPHAGGKSKPPHVGIAETCWSCEGSGCSLDDTDGEYECRACAGVGYRRDYTVGAALFERLRWAGSAAELATLIDRHADGAEQAEALFRLNHLHQQADLVAAEAGACRVIVAALTELAERQAPRPPEPPGPTGGGGRGLTALMRRWWHRVTGGRPPVRRAA